MGISRFGVEGCRPHPGQRDSRCTVAPRHTERPAAGAIRDKSSEVRPVPRVRVEQVVFVRKCTSPALQVAPLTSGSVKFKQR